MNNKDFLQANKIFSAMKKKLKEEVNTGFNNPLAADDLRKMYDSFNISTSRDLHNKVCFRLYEYLSATVVLTICEI